MAPSDRLLHMTTTATTHSSSQPSLMESTSIRSRLVQSLGVQPSTEWLHACLEHIHRRTINNHHSGNNNNTPVVIDAVLYQLLHSDLRDVVRGGTSRHQLESTGHAFGGFQTAAALSSISSNNARAAMASQQQLHQAIQKSKQEQFLFRQTLDESFSLLCQLEEVVDVALPAEKRLEVGAATSSPQQSHSSFSSSRCLKLCLTDGYNTTTGSVLNPSYLVAVEIQGPIPNLSATSPAGLKILLKGKINLRHGQIFLHPGNAFVVGGNVPELMQKQALELQKAKQAAGIGIDPTLRALVGTSIGDDDANNNHDNDEQNEASGDVVGPPPQQQPSFINSITLSTSVPTTQNMPPPQPSSSISTVRSAWVASNTASFASDTTYSSSQSRTIQAPQQQRSILPPPPPTPTQRTPPRPSTTVANIRPTINPYNINSGSGGNSSIPSLQVTSMSTSNNTSNNRNPYAQQQQRKSIVATETLTLTKTLPTNPNHPGPLQSFENNVNTNSILSNTNSSMSSSFATNSAPLRTSGQTATHPAAFATDALLSDTTTTTVQNMTFSNLYILLHHLLSGSQEMYQSYQAQKMSFRVPMTYCLDSPVRFDVIKASKKDRKVTVGNKREKKYEYMTATFFQGMEDHGVTTSSSSSFSSSTTPNNNSNNNNDLPQKVICCQLHPSVLAPHFDVPAAELRSLSRTDRERSIVITNEGGERVKQQFFVPCVWTATLLQVSPDQLFDGADHNNKSMEEKFRNLDYPLLMLQDPEPFSPSST